MSRDSIIRDTREYLTGSCTSRPLFIAFDSADDLSFLLQQVPATCKRLVLSSFCVDDDAFPDLDAFFTKLNNDRQERLVVLGCGEYAELSGDRHFLSRLFDIQVAAAQKIVVLLWNGYDFLEEMRGDPRIDETRVLSFTPTRKIWHLKNIPSCINVDALHGFKRVLTNLERGCDREVVVKTSCTLNGKWCRNITSAFELYGALHPSGNLCRDWFSEEQWGRFLDDNRVRDERFWSPDAFLNLKLNSPSHDAYLMYVIDKTDVYSEYRYNLLTAILDTKSTDKGFPVLYAGWKNLLKHFSEDDIRRYLAEAKRFDAAERLAYLTDNTCVEQLEVLEIISELNRVPDAIKQTYPLFAAYIEEYKFTLKDNPDLSSELTDYFNSYKRQKVFNELLPDFIDRVERVAEMRPYNMLPTRGSVLEKLKDRRAHLIWLDALGCEFLGFIQRKSADLGLKITINITRAKLPTLTSVNRDFYDEWVGTKDQSKKLDALKHGDFDSCGHDCSKIPVELVYELNTLDEILKSIAGHLKSGKSPAVILASDHGATRLGVIGESELLWELPEKGKHSGRCCKSSEYDGPLPLYVAHDDDNAWNVMANYSRFRGGRKGDVEVHGGATLEEVVVPVIKFELLDMALKIELLTKEVKPHYRDNTIKLVLFCAQPLENLSIEFNTERYFCTTMPETPLKHEVVLPKPRAGEYTLATYDGDTKLNSVTFSVKSAGAGVKKDNFF